MYVPVAVIAGGSPEDCHSRWHRHSTGRTDTHLQDSGRWSSRTIWSVIILISFEAQYVAITMCKRAMLESSLNFTNKDGKLEASMQAVAFQCLFAHCTQAGMKYTQHLPFS